MAQPRTTAITGQLRQPWAWYYQPLVAWGAVSGYERTPTRALACAFADMLGVL
jgi:hypothetical protein